MLRVRDVILPLAKLAGTGHQGWLFGNGDAEHKTPWADVGRADVWIKSRRNGRRRSGVCQTPATAKKKKPDGIPRNGRKGQNQRIPLPARVCRIFCYLSQARQEFDAINRPVRYFLDAGSDTRDVKQKESKRHESRHPDNLTEDLLEGNGHDGKA